MTTRAAFLTQPYSAYNHREIPDEDEELTHVGPGTPCGEYFRRFWHPVIYSEELLDLPVRIRILGEDLVVFRDKRDKVGLLELHCSHRGTSLEFGLTSEKGIRCCYHGWLYDVDGTILETPGEPTDSTLKDRLHQGAYPTHEYKGLVFAYMGPPEEQPPFPIYDTMVDVGQPGYRPSAVAGGKFLLPCNWLQVKENSMDPAHTAFLHTIISGSQFTAQFGVLPEIDFKETETGMIYTATRRIGDNVWVRMKDFILPNMHQVAPDTEDASKAHLFARPWLTQWGVPVDDHNTLNFRLRHYTEDEWNSDNRPPVLTFGQAGDREYEEGQRQPGDYEAQMSIHWGMSRHGLEHLATTDRGVIMFRSMIRQGIQNVKEGQDPKGLSREAGKVVRTYANNTVLPFPPAATPEEDKLLLQKTAEEVSEGYLKNPPPL